MATVDLPQKCNIEVRKYRRYSHLFIISLVSLSRLSLSLSSLSLSLSLSFSLQHTFLGHVHEPQVFVSVCTHTLGALVRLNSYTTLISIAYRYLHTAQGRRISRSFSIIVCLFVHSSVLKKKRDVGSCSLNPCLLLPLHVLFCISMNGQQKQSLHRTHYSCFLLKFAIFLVLSTMMILKFWGERVNDS